MRPEYKKKAIRSYVIRAGRMTDGQKNAFDEWWPVYGLSLFDGELDLRATFERDAPWWWKSVLVWGIPCWKWRRTTQKWISLELKSIPLGLGA